jgi:HPt (histidine-containing phosphotransfer) domain-containing protein
LSTIDMSMIEAIGGRVGMAEVLGFVREAVQEAENACSRMRDQSLAPEQLIQLAHRLRGTATSFGLVRIGAAAAAIEQQARSSGAVDALLSELAAAIGETRREAAGLRLAAA